MADVGKSRVDEIWKQLNGGGLKSTSNASFSKLWHTLNADPSLRTTATSARRAPAASLPAAKHAQKTVSAAIALVPGRVGSTATEHQPCTPAMDTITVPALPAPTVSLQRAVAQLQDPIAARRKEALAAIRAHALHCQAERGVLQDVLDGDVGKAVLKRFDDKAEACRERAAELYHSLLKACPDAILAVLPYVMPVLEERLQHEQGQARLGNATSASRDDNRACWQALTEPCEEIRLQLMQLLHLVVSTARKAIGAYATEAVALAESGALDPFYEVNIVACSIVNALNGILGLHLHTVAKQLVANFLPLTTHNRHKVRIAAIQAVRATMFQNAHEMILEMVAFRDPNLVPIKAFYGNDLKVNFCGKLSTDSHPQVRREFLDMVGDWLLHLRERQDHEHRLLPYVLSAVADPHPANAEAALHLVEELGKLHIKDKGKELEDTLRYLPQEAHALGWSIPGVEDHVYSRATTSLQSTAGTSKPAVIPAPFTTRPSLGARMIVQANFGRTCGALAAELATWVQELRLRAAQLLLVSLVYLEDHVSNHLHVLLPALIKVVSEPELGPIVEESLSLMGCFLRPEVWLRYITPGLDDSQADSGVRSCSLAAAAALVRGALPGTSHNLEPLGSCLVLPSNLKSEDVRVKHALERLLQALLDYHPTVCLGLRQEVLLSLLYLGSSQLHSGDEQAEHRTSAAKRMAEQLSTHCSASDLDALMQEHREKLLEKVLDGCSDRHSSMDLAALSLLLAPTWPAAGAARCSVTGAVEACSQGARSCGLSRSSLAGLCAFLEQVIQGRPGKAAFTSFLAAFGGSLGATDAEVINACGSLGPVLQRLCGQEDADILQLALSGLNAVVRQRVGHNQAAWDDAPSLVPVLTCCLSSSSAAIRQQACKALEATVRSRSSSLMHSASKCENILEEASGKVNMQALSEAVLARCYDSNEDVQAAAVQLLGTVLEALSVSAVQPLLGTGAAHAMTASSQLHEELLANVQRQHTQWGDGEVQVQATALLKRFA